MTDINVPVKKNLQFRSKYISHQAISDQDETCKMAYIARRTHKWQNRGCRHYTSTKYTDVYIADENCYARSLNSERKRRLLRRQRESLSLTCQRELGLDSYLRPIEYKNFLHCLSQTKTDTPTVYNVLLTKHDTQPS